MNPFRAEDWVSFGRKFFWQILFIQSLVLFFLGFFVNQIFINKTSHKTAKENTSLDSNKTHQHSNSTGDSTNQLWTCAMHPQIRQRKPGKCPICSMELVPVKSSSGGLRTLTIKPSVKKLMRVETVPAQRRYVSVNIRMVGKVEYDETKVSHITAWVPGRLDRLYADFTGIQVNKGDHMVYIYSEELYSIQEELIQALKFQKSGVGTGRLNLVNAAREKLRLLGLTEQQIKEIEQRDRPERHVNIFSPQSGIVIKKLKQEGDRVRIGERIYTVADLSRVWIQLDAYESDLTWLRYGQTVSFTTEAYPGEFFSGQVSFISPVLNKETRTVKVRVNADNRDGRLKPEMFVRSVVESNIASGGKVLDAKLAGKWISPMHPEIVSDMPGKCKVCGMPLVRAETLGYVKAETNPGSKPLVIPASAVLLTGTRAIVYVELPESKEPTYEGREVLLGPRAGDYYLVRNGLSEGEMVVTNGNFKIDSALQIQAKPTMMTPEGGGGGGGHNHGGETKKTSGTSASPSMQMELPSDFRDKLHGLLLVGQEINGLTRSNKSTELRNAYKKFSTLLNQTNGESLRGHPAMLWKEIRMLLGNDAIEGKDAIGRDEAIRVELSLQKNLTRMSKLFALHFAHSKPSHSVTITVSSEFRIQLKSLLTEYFDLQSSLAGDKKAETGQAIREVQKSFQAINSNLLGDSAKEYWAKEEKQLRSIIDKLGKVQDIKAARTEFVLLSEQLLVILNRLKFSDMEIYEFHCPMAFEGRGAIWLQNNKTTRNPYFGSSMLSCADRVRKIEFNLPANKTHKEHKHE